MGLLWILYSTILWIIYILYYLYAIHGNYENDVLTVALFLAPIVLGPLAIFYFRKMLRWIYLKRLSSIKTNLASLRKQQKLKVEELNKKTAYYSTKSLLDRYDPTSEKKKELDEEKRKKMMQEAKRGKAAPSTAAAQLKHTQPPPKQHWYDKVADALVGDSGPETKYALICIHCYAHNGLVLPQEVDTIQYTCPHCHQFNPSRKSRKLHPEGPVLPPMSPKPTPKEEETSTLRQRNTITKENSPSD